MPPCCCCWLVWEAIFTRPLRGHPESAQSGVKSVVSISSQSPTEPSGRRPHMLNRLMAYNEGNAPGLSAAMRFALKGRHKTVLWNPFRVRVRMVREPGAAFIRIRGFFCPRLICTSLSGSITASIKYNSFVVWGRPHTSFRVVEWVLQLAVRHLEFRPRLARRAGSGRVSCA